jgi:hypothetical protein
VAKRDEMGHQGPQADLVKGMAQLDKRAPALGAMKAEAAGKWLRSAVKKVTTAWKRRPGQKRPIIREADFSWPARRAWRCAAWKQAQPHLSGSSSPPPRKRTFTSSTRPNPPSRRETRLKRQMRDTNRLRAEFKKKELAWTVHTPIPCTKLTSYSLPGQTPTSTR